MHGAAPYLITACSQNGRGRALQAWCSLTAGAHLAEAPGSCAGNFAADLKHEMSRTKLTVPEIPPPPSHLHYTAAVLICVITAPHFTPLPPSVIAKWRRSPSSPNVPRPMARGRSCAQCACRATTGTFGRTERPMHDAAEVVRAPCVRFAGDFARDRGPRGETIPLWDIQNVPTLCVLPLLGCFTDFASMCGSKDISPNFEGGELKKKKTCLEGI